MTMRRLGFLLCRCQRLALYAAVSATAGESLNLVNSHEVEVTGDSLLEGRCCHGKLESLTLGGHGEQTVDVTARE